MSDPEQRRHYEEKRERARSGDVDALYEVATCVYEGLGTEANQARGIKLYEHAAERGHAGAHLKLYYVFSEQEGPTFQATHHLHQAAEKNHPEAQLVLAGGFWEGLNDDIPKDPCKAWFWFSRAAHQGYAPGQYMAALFCYGGMVVPRDYAKAFKWVEKARAQPQTDEVELLMTCLKNDSVEAAERGDRNAQLVMAFLYEFGLGVPRDAALAETWMRRANQPQNQARPASPQSQQENIPPPIPPPRKENRTNPVPPSQQDKQTTGPLNHHEHIPTSSPHKPNEHRKVKLVDFSQESNQANADKSPSHVKSLSEPSGSPNLQVDAVEKETQDRKVPASPSHRKTLSEPAPTTFQLEMVYRKASLGDSEACFQLGDYQLEERHNTNLALDWFQTAAKEGHIAAQHKLGMLYSNRMPEPDLCLAAEWFSKAADQNHAPSQFQLGTFYEDGKGVDQDAEMAMECYCKAAKQGHFEAQHRLGLILSEGKPAPKLGLAVEWFAKAADQDYAPSQFKLGTCYEHGTGVDPDMEKAVILYRKSSQQGYPQAQFSLATCYATGNGVPEEPELALALYMEAAQQGLAAAAYSLAFCCYAGVGTKPDVVRAAEWVAKALENADEEMICFFVQSAENCLEEAENEDPESQAFLSFMYAFGLGVEQDDVLAETWMVRAQQLAGRGDRASTIAAITSSHWIVSNNLQSPLPSITPVVGPSPNCMAVQESRLRMKEVLEKPDAEPEEFSVDYIKQCTDNFSNERHLGEGAFGKVYLGKDEILNCQFAVKRVSLAMHDKSILEQVTLSFRREIATLKRFHHPNIVALYGFNMRMHHNQQFLVYEYASLGSLNGFLLDDRGRCRLSGSIRLSIMYQIARALLFLHTGCRDNFIVFHRDIKAANICLDRDFTAKLIDCGMAKFVVDDSVSTKSGSLTPSILSPSGSMVFGTRGYICPVYARGNTKYVEACDIYAVGVVMTELILGCLQLGQSTRNGKNFGDFFARYVKDDYDRPVETGWKLLADDADPLVEWEQDVLASVCKLAVCCMAPTPLLRFKTCELVELVNEAIRGRPDVVDSFLVRRKSYPLVLIANPAENTDLSTTEETCFLCHRALPGLWCSKNHFTCVQCLEEAVAANLGSSSRSVGCKIDDCNRQPFTDNELYGKISSPMYNLYITERNKQEVIDRRFFNIEELIKKCQQQNEAMLHHQLNILQGIDAGLRRSLRALAFLTSGDFKKCPSLIWLIPADQHAGRNITEWARAAVRKKYHLFFICQHSLKPVWPPLEIEVPRSFLVQIAPALKIGLFLLHSVCTVITGLPFPVSSLPVIEQLRTSEAFVNLLLGAKTHVMEQCEQIFTEGKLLGDASPVQALVGQAFDLVAEKANKPKLSYWKKKMVPVIDQNSSTIWVKNEFICFY